MLHRRICVLPPWPCTMPEIRADLLSRVARLHKMHLTSEQSAAHVSQLLVAMSRRGWTPRPFRTLYYAVRGKPPSIVMKVLWAALLMMSVGSFCACLCSNRSFGREFPCLSRIIVSTSFLPNVLALLFHLVLHSSLSRVLARESRAQSHDTPAAHPHG